MLYRTLQIAHRKTMLYIADEIRSGNWHVLPWIDMAEEFSIALSEMESPGGIEQLGSSLAS